MAHTTAEYPPIRGTSVPGPAYHGSAPGHKATTCTTLLRTSPKARAFGLVLSQGSRPSAGPGTFVFSWRCDGAVLDVELRYSLLEVRRHIAEAFGRSRNFLGLGGNFLSHRRNILRAGRDGAHLAMSLARELGNWPNTWTGQVLGQISELTSEAHSEMRSIAAGSEDVAAMTEEVPAQSEEVTASAEGLRDGDGPQAGCSAVQRPGPPHRISKRIRTCPGPLTAATPETRPARRPGPSGWFVTGWCKW